ncbi:LAME_0G08438g1_1 [Lachancea meyersii CBS 8951]|uniref:LAME_0G08438g1_1 n=1 Tax=Lachancea meyersii CBS 8951 TaxID=1266667 RepID=A0A1G4K881_9SACH|nr:LAME_0G08438g1_1 [Lachancea meyersii CBS 8951]
MASSAHELPAFRLKRYLDLDERVDAARSFRLKTRSRIARSMRVAGASSLNVSSHKLVTPSMSSVLSQLKSQRLASFPHLSSSHDHHDDGCSVATLSLDEHSDLENRLSSVDSARSVSTTSSLESVASDRSSWTATKAHNHPLETAIITPTATLPRLKLVNPQDLDLADHAFSFNSLQLCEPVYQRPKATNRPSHWPRRRTSVDLTIDTDTNIGTAQYLDTTVASASQSRRRRSSSCLLYDSDVVELENWPRNHQRQEPRSQTHPVSTTHTAPVPNRRIRQQTFNPHFLKLYAWETASKTQNLIPDLNVDEQVLRRLSYRDIWNLEVPPTSQARGVSAHDIKLALITRKKLWSDMMCEPRHDLHGDHAPWNLRFVVSPEQETSSNPITTSLVRVNSDIKPWMGPTSNLMLRPSGKIPLTRASSGRPLRELHYVVKGWCDARFVSS